uniref:Chaperone clpb, putative n=1 Tax=Arundo donax TaxID=35708 RepID=A0A0A8XUK6_ARUDO
MLEVYAQQRQTRHHTLFYASLHYPRSIRNLTL